eukprot:5350047-Alexandrium_andersonii.AAC.1
MRDELALAEQLDVPQALHRGDPDDLLQEALRLPALLASAPAVRGGGNDVGLHLLRVGLRPLHDLAALLLGKGVHCAGEATPAVVASL